MVTIKMVAKQCGYSVATVSKALNGASDVSAETAALIRAVASDMGYTPNSAARALKTTRSYNFGVLFEDATNSGLTHEFFSYILQSFKRRSEELGYDISFISNRLGGRSVSYTEHARYRNYDGVLIASVEFRDPAVLELASSGIPVVAVDYSFHRCGSILSDNIQGMRDLVSHVYSLGHRRIAFIHGELTAVTRDRITGFQRQCLEFGIDIPKEYIVEGRYHSPDVSGELTRQLMALPTPPTCILYPDDISYIGGFNALERMGLSVPADVSAVGYDGVNLSQVITPRLTTLRQDTEAMGERSAEELARAVEEGISYVPQTIVIPGTLLPGETVKRIG